MAHKTVCRVEPLKSKDLKGVQIHNKRESEYSNVDESLSHLNRDFNIGSGDVLADVTALLEKYPLPSKKTTNVAGEMVLSASPEYFTDGTPEQQKERLDIWVKTNVDWLKEKYGEGLVSCDLHLDENTPHLQAVIVPLHTYEKKNQHGSTTVTKTHYNNVFGDKASLIAKARKEQNSELTKCGRLQTEYAKAVEHLGIERGELNSLAKRNTLQEFRKAVERGMTGEFPEFKQLPKPEPETKTQAAMRIALGKPEPLDIWSKQNDKRLEKWQAENKDYIQGIKAMAVKAGLDSKTNKSNESLVKNLRSQNQELRAEAKEMKEEIEISKEQVNNLRRIPVEKVAHALGYEGEIHPRNHRNAIDLVKDVEGFDYKESVQWLNDHFDSDTVQKEITTHIQDTVNNIDIKERLSDSLAAPQRPPSKQEYAIQHETAKQLAALGADGYRVTLMHETNVTINLCKDRNGGEEKFFSAEKMTAPSTVRFLNIQNYKEGRNVFITPKDSKNDYIFIDDMTKESMQKMESEGYTFATILESSPSNFQGILKVAKGEHNKSDLNAVFRDLNKIYGDKNIGAAEHPFRVVGYQNMKQKHLQANGLRPIAKLHKAENVTCSKLNSDLEKKVQERKIEDSLMHSGKMVNKLDRIIVMKQAKSGTKKESQKSIQFAKDHYQKMESRYGKAYDFSRADFMLAKGMAENGYSQKAIVQTMLKTSPDIGKRKADVRKYADATIKAATIKAAAPEKQLVSTEKKGVSKEKAQAAVKKSRFKKVSAEERKAELQAVKNQASAKAAGTTIKGPR